MKRLLLMYLAPPFPGRIVLASVAMLALCSAASFAENRQGTRAWWIEKYGVVSAGEEPLVGRAEKVFGKVLSAADKGGKRFPRLVVLREEGAPYAVAIHDGSILLTRGAIRVCYDGVGPEAGDARLAFILGHELAHLAKDDYWHMTAFSAVRNFAGDREAAEGILKLLKDTTDLRDTRQARDVAKMKELQADAYGIVYMTMAGFDPGAIVGPDGKNFFREWVLQVNGRIAYEDKDHPGPMARAEFARTQLASVVDDLGYFRFGARLYQLGRYEDAALMLEKFRETFPSREVFNDIGLCYFNMAVRTLSRCDEALALRFRFSTVLDVDTLGSRINTRGGGGASSSCLEDGQFVKEVKEASENLRHATEKDPFYLPARINLASTLILSGDYPRALAESAKALELEPGNGSALNNKAVAMYLFGVSSAIDTGGSALSILGGLSTPEAIYNKTVILDELGRKSAAREAGEAFLKVEPEGAHASRIRERMGIDASPAAHAKAAEKIAAAPGAPIPPGRITPTSREKLLESRKKNFDLGNLRGTFFEGRNQRVLVIDDSVEIVESDLAAPVDAGEFRERHGKPSRVVETVAGVTGIYPGFAVDESGGKITRFVFFTGPGP